MPWLCCYLPGTGVDQDRIAFEVVARGDRIEFEVIETAAGVVSTGSWLAPVTSRAC